MEIIANDQGNCTTSSYVSFSDNECLIGDAAKNEVAMNPQYVNYSHTGFAQDNFELTSFFLAIVFNTKCLSLCPLSSVHYM
jgi:hypothetical protein